MDSATTPLSDSPELARVFAGEDYEAARVPGELTRFDDRSAHYEVRLTPTSVSAP